MSSGSPVKWCREPTLTEILADPIVQAIMAADEVDPKQLWETLCGTTVKAVQYLPDQE
jgi:hypothetical protein